jgi:hypothetical protein
MLLSPDFKLAGINQSHAESNVVFEIEPSMIGMRVAFEQEINNPGNTRSVTLAFHPGMMA